ncbi:hypothetical protein ACVJF1_001596 [Bradyrhizobium diazoefficiens]
MFWSATAPSGNLAAADGSFCDEISHFTRKDVKNLVWLALTDLEEDAMEFSVDARA